MPEYDITAYCSGCNTAIGEKEEAHCLECIEKLNAEVDEKNKQIQNLEDEKAQIEQELYELKEDIRKL